MRPSVRDLSRGVIHKVSGNLRVKPNFCDYAEAVGDFSWDAARREMLDDLPEVHGLNIAHEAVDRHAAGPRGRHPAVRWLGRDGSVRDLSFFDLARLSNQFANVLARLRVGTGDAVFTLTGRIPELHVVALGTLKYGGVFAPLSRGLDEEAVRTRLALGSAKVIVTTPELFAAKVRPILHSLPTLEHVLLTGELGPLSRIWRRRGTTAWKWAAARARGAARRRRGARIRGGAHAKGGRTSGGAPGGAEVPRPRLLRRLMDVADNQFEIRPTDALQPALLHFDEGPGGLRGVVHPHRVVLAHHVAGRLALDIHDEDILWCTAEPGRICGTAYGIIAPLCCGITSIVDEAAMDPERWYRILDEQCVTVWLTEARSVRSLMRLGTRPLRDRDCDHLRLAITSGPGLGADAVYWGVDTLGLPFHEDWAQTETAGIAIANFACMDIVPGSVGKPVPGFEAAIVRRTGVDSVETIDLPDHDGELALRADNPALFAAYIGDERHYQARLAGGWYLSGNRARRDDQGYFRITGGARARA